jgi:predicted ATPase
VDLAPLCDPAGLADTVARALSIEIRGAADATLAIARAIGSRRMLVVLDNCEHLIARAAALTEALLRGAPDLVILATSREPLAIAGESAYRVPPLTTPDPARTHTPAELSRYAAAELFLERARAASQSFELTADNATTVAKICDQLDGIPLALELAAARLRSLSVHEIHDRLDDRFRLLTVGARTALPRQKTLRALVDWSHDLLDDRQRVLFRRLAVFSGGFALREAEAATTDAALARADVLDVLGELVERSIVIAEARGAATRYRLLETLRQYGRERLGEAGETGALRARHRDVYLQFVEDLSSRFAGSPGDAEWFARLGEEHDNVREAIRESLEPRDGAPSVAPRFAAALRRYWLVRGHYAEALGFLLRMLELHRDPTRARLDLLEAANTFATLLFDYAKALDHLREALAIACELGERSRESVVRTHLAYVHFLQNELTAANRLAAEALPVAREVGGFPLVFALNISGMSAARAGGDERGVSLLEECRAVTETSGSRQYHANVLESLGKAYALRDGGYERALPLFRACGEIFTRVGDAQGEIGTCERMAEVAAARGQQRLAARILGAVDGMRERLGCPREPVYAADLAPTMTALASALAPAALEQADREGRAMSFADAVGEAMRVE